MQGVICKRKGKSERRMCNKKPCGHGRGQVKRSRERERHDSRREELTMMQ